MSYSEADTREELINPQLEACGWKTGGNVIVKREYHITKGRLTGVNTRDRPLSADYVLIYKNVKLAVIEAKKRGLLYTEGVAQAKKYAGLLKTRFAYATNGGKIYQIDTQAHKEGEVKKYPPPDELWRMTFQSENELFNRLSAISPNTDGQFELRYYQENAVSAAIKAISEGKKRVLLTLATGTGKTRIAFQIVWKLMKAKWNTHEPGAREPRILFLADRNILADQAYNAFDALQNARKRITPEEIAKNGSVPTAQSIFFTIFQTFMSGDKPSFGQYPKDFFDLVIIDECHRGGANDESKWRQILEYFNKAVHIGLTATPKRDVNIDTYAYFGEPVYSYSLKQGIEDGFLTPFRVRKFSTDMETYTYDPSDDVEGDIDPNKTYQANEIFIEDRERKRVEAFMREIGENDKTLVFCSTQQHAGLIRDLINRFKQKSNYCARVTAADGKDGEGFLRLFQDTGKTIPAILTTSQKLSTGVDAIQIKNIVLLKTVNSMIEFKQIIGRGTRLCDDKAYFTIYDFSNASERFEDKEWDGDFPTISQPDEGKTKNGGERGADEPAGRADEPAGTDGPHDRPLITVKLGNGREVNLTDSGTLFYDKNGRLISAKEFIQNLIGRLPDFFKSEEDLRQQWADPVKRQELLKRFEEQGYPPEKLKDIQKAIRAENADVFDVLSLLSSFNGTIKTRAERAEQCKIWLMNSYKEKQRAFIEFVLGQYVRGGVFELDPEKVDAMVKLKYGTIADGKRELGEDILEFRKIFLDFQKYLYKEAA